MTAASSGAVLIHFSDTYESVHQKDLFCNPLHRFLANFPI